MSILHVQSGVHGAASGVTTSIAVTLGAAVTSGNLLAGFVFWPTATLTDLTSVTDDKGNSYTVVDKVQASGVGLGWNRSWGSFYLPNITNGPITITANFATSMGIAEILVDEYSGVATASPLDGHAMQAQGTPGTGTDAVSSGSFTTANSGDLIYAGAVDLQGSGGGLNAGTGFTIRTHSDSQDGANFFSTEDEIQSAAGSIAGTFTLAIATNATICGAMAFSAPGGGGGFTPKFRRTLSQLGTRIGSRQLQG